MSPDDAADLIGDLSAERGRELLDLMDPDETKDVEHLLGYPEDTAGGIMTTEFAAVSEELTAHQILNKFKEIAEEVESIYYIYALSKSGDLSGVISLRELLLADPDEKLEDFMTKELITVDVMEEEHEVAKKIAKYNLIVLPVVNSKNNLEGMVTIDDAIDIVLPTAWKKQVPRMFGR
jgi:Mg/Co/Ni transporter MgtE